MTNSTFCHWCEFDNACHAIGSIYGCVSGVNCYSIDNCQRLEPEPASALDPPAGVTVLFVFLGLVCFCGLTACVFVSNRVKLAYLALLPTPPPPSSDKEAAGGRRVPIVERLFELKPFSSPFEGRKKKRSRGPSLDLGEDLDYDLALVDNDGMEPVQTTPREVEEDGNRKAVERVNENKAHIQCLWRSCLSFYVICLLFLTTSISLILVLWPHYPTYSMCSDELRWSSIIEGMTHLQTKASYQLLISIYNPNVFDAVVDYGSGIMSHENVNVGILDFGENVLIKGTSITDVLVTATFSPDKWETLGLTAEYYDGTLTFLVNADVTVTIPAISYTQSSKWSNYLLHLNGEYGDRSLCACEKW